MPNGKLFVLFLCLSRDLWKLNRTVVWTPGFPLCREAVDIPMGSLMAHEQLS